MDYFKNQQDFLAQRNDWMDKSVTRISQSAVMKVASYKELHGMQKDMMADLIRKQLFNNIENSKILEMEDYYSFNLHN